jgi:hypothetical protein
MQEPEYLINLSKRFLRHKRQLCVKYLEREEPGKFEDRANEQWQRCKSNKDRDRNCNNKAGLMRIPP